MSDSAPQVRLYIIFTPVPYNTFDLYFLPFDLYLQGFRPQDGSGDDRTRWPFYMYILLVEIIDL